MPERPTPERSAPGRRRAARALAGVAAVVALAGTTAACGTGPTTTAAGTIRAVGAENEYADVLSQIGGRYVSVSSVLDNPDTDPHTFESSPSVARQVSRAQLVVQNGAGYDTFINRLESASPAPERKVIVAQDVLGLPTDTPNPHLWYDPGTMPAVARAITADLSKLQPGHRSYFHTNLARFDRSLLGLHRAIAAFRAEFAGTPVATTEPVADYLLQAMGARDLTPWGLQTDVMNGVDPTAQDISMEKGLFTGHRVKVLCYNPQVADPLTGAIRKAALAAGVPVVGVYETMPTPGYDFQSWMTAELDAVRRAIVDKTSTEHL